MDLEPLFHTVVDDSVVDLVLTVQLVCPGATCCKTVVHHQECITDISMEKGVGKITIFGAKLKNINGRFWILNTPDTFVVSHPVDSLQSLSIVEACSGIGAVSLGYKAAGLETTIYIEQNKRFVDWLRANQKEVIQGNIGDIATIRQVAGLKLSSHILSAGVSCQPFSKLGDQKHEFDERSQSFPSALLMGHLLQSVAITLECTTGVNDSQWAQQLISEFCKQTGFHHNQKILKLHTMWPARRTRWWAVLSHPSMNLGPIPDLPVLEFEPSVLALMPANLSIPKPQIDQLELDLYELRHFHS